MGAFASLYNRFMADIITGYKTANLHVWRILSYSIMRIYGTM